MKTKEQMKEYLEECQKAYAHGEPLISDEEYDVLLEEYLKENGGEDARPFMRNKQSAAVNDIVCTLPKVYGVQEPMREGQKTYEDWLRKEKIDTTAEIILQPKFDGCSVAYDFQQNRFFTRGDFDNGESLDVTEIFQQKYTQKNIENMILRGNRIGELEQWIPLSMKFEAIMSDEIYMNGGFYLKYKRPRDAVSAMIMSRNVEDARYITLIPLRIYWKDSDGNPAQTIPYEFANSFCAIFNNKRFESIQQFIKNLLNTNASVSLFDMIMGKLGNYACDGVVVSVIWNTIYDDNYDETDIAFHEINPDQEVAIKILNMVKETTLIDIDWQFGKTGRITPVAIVEPVTFQNVNVTHVGLSTFERVINMQLKAGDTVRIAYNIVPYFLNSLHNGDYPIPIPTKCPKCGADLDMRVSRLIRCTNPNCTGKKLGDIIRYVEKMKMMGISKNIITNLYENGYITSIPDLYKIDLEALSREARYGEKSCKNIKETILKASHNVKIERWLGALPCLDVSEKTWKTLLLAIFANMNQATKSVVKLIQNYQSPNKFLEEILQYVDGIGPATIRSINEGIRVNWNDIRNTMSYITFDIPEEEDETDTISSSKGRVSLTGTRDKDIIDLLLARGYEVDNFTAKSIALIVPNKNFISTKTIRAAGLNIPIYTIEEAKEALQ